MKRPNLFRAAAFSLALAAGLSAHAQGTNPTGPGNTSTQKAGEAYPNDPNAANPNKPRPAVVDRAANSRPAQATKRVTRKATNAVKRTGNRAASALRNTGDSINRRVPPGPNDSKR
jgi:hypothetical protein